MRKVPEVFLLVTPEDFSVVSYKVCDVDELVFFALRFLVALDDCAGNDADVVLLGKGSVSVEVDLPLAAKVDEVWVFGNPVREVVLWEDGELGAF